MREQSSFISKLKKTWRCRKTSDQNDQRVDSRAIKKRRKPEFFGGFVMSSHKIVLYDATEASFKKHHW